MADAAVAVAVLMAGCGGGGSSTVDIVLDSVPAATTTIGRRPRRRDDARSRGDARLGCRRRPHGAGPRRSARRGSRWPATLVGLESECGNVTVASQPRADLFLAGIALNGLWSVAPGTSEWTAVGAGGDPIENRMVQLLVDPTNPDRYWESGSYGSERRLPHRRPRRQLPRPR